MARYKVTKQQLEMVVESFTTESDKTISETKQKTVKKTNKK